LTVEALNLFNELRELVFRMIELSLEEDGYCKSYEGSMGITFPNYFQDRESHDVNGYGITLDCYLIGPHRHYSWNGKSLMSALKRAEVDIRAWYVEWERTMQFY
jgi:hypothetical protein